MRALQSLFGAMLCAWPGLAIVWEVSFWRWVVGKRRWLGDAHPRKRIGHEAARDGGNKPSLTS